MKKLAGAALLSAALALLAAFASLSGCYLLKQGTYLLGHNARSRPIEKVLAGADLNADERSLLRQVQEIRRYAVQELGLEDNRNFTRYLELERDYLVKVVSACSKTSFSAYQWRFPFFGSFPYKGFYRPEDAERLAARLERRGFDVWVREVDGFSTLGFFSDPIYSFMTGYSLFALADLIIHEQTHATIFLKNEVQFNEELATFLGREGALCFIREHLGEGSEEYRKAVASLHDWQVYCRRVLDLYEELERLYAQAPDEATALAEKERMVAEFNRRLAAEAGELFRTESFHAFKGIPANNAYIMTFVQYSQDLEMFYALHRSRGGDLRETVAVLKQVKDMKGPPKESLRQLAAITFPSRSCPR